MPSTSHELQEISFKEPDIKWENSEAKKILYQDLLNGHVPLEARANGKSTTKLQDIYAMHPEYSLYSYRQFSSRLRSLRTTAKRTLTRKTNDMNAFKICVQNHAPSFFSKKGYIQWQGSDAQRWLIEDMKAGLHKQNKPKVFWQSRASYCEEFPLPVF